MVGEFTAAVARPGRLFANGAARNERGGRE